MIDSSFVNKAVLAFRKGKIVIFPTDTVWGIGVSIESLEAINRLYQIKKRDSSRPTAVLVGLIEQARVLGEISNQGIAMINKYWPGGLTIVVKAKNIVPKLIQGNGQKVGLRMPNNDLLLAILGKLNCGIVASSANFSGKPAPWQKEMIDPRLIDLSDLVIKGETLASLPSTVIDLTMEPYQVIRSGLIPSGKLPLDK